MLINSRHASSSVYIPSYVTCMKHVFNWSVNDENSSHLNLTWCPTSSDDLSSHPIRDSGGEFDQGTIFSSCKGEVEVIETFSAEMFWATINV